MSSKCCISSESGGVGGADVAVKVCLRPERGTRFGMGANRNDRGTSGSSSSSSSNTLGEVGEAPKLSRMKAFPSVPILMAEKPLSNPLPGDMGDVEIASL